MEINEVEDKLKEIVNEIRSVWEFVVTMDHWFYRGMSVTKRAEMFKSLLDHLLTDMKKSGGYFSYYTFSYITTGTGGLVLKLTLRWNTEPSQTTTDLELRTTEVDPVATLMGMSEQLTNEYLKV